MCFGRSKEPSHWDGSFEYPQNKFWMGNKENGFPISKGLRNNDIHCTITGLPRSGKKFWKMKNFPGQGITFSVREILKK